MRRPLSRSKSSKDTIIEGSRQIHPYQKIYLDQNKLNQNLTSCLTRQCGLVLITGRILLFPHWCSIFSDRNGSLSLVMFNSFTWVMGWDGMFGQGSNMNIFKIVIVPRRNW
jgi:hypothetical protein